MINVDASVTINRPPGDVFSYMIVQENAQNWMTGMVETRPTSETTGVGYTWIDVVQVFGRQVSTEFETIELEQDKKIVFKSIDGPMPISGSYSYAASGAGTEVRFRMEAEPGGFFKLAEPLLARSQQRQWETNLANLKDVLEGQE